MKDILSKISESIKVIAGVPDPKNYFNSAIIAAAGSGTRMKSDIPKQMIMLDGMPVIARTVETFEKCSFIDEIIIVTSDECMSQIMEYCDMYSWKKIKAITLGGATRTESVTAGFKLISDKSDYVFIHDAARCLVTDDIIRRVAEQAYIYKAATAAEKITSTLKQEKKGGFIADTLDRDTIWAAQTPQVFRTELYRAASYLCYEEGFTATDDCMLAEHCGFSVKLVDCGHENIKLTSPLDLVLAKAILDMRKK